MLSYLDWSSPLDAIQRLTLFRQVSSHTKVSREKLNRLYDLAHQIDRESVPGAIVECGVFKGGAAALLAHAAPSRDIYLFDSFEGLPPPGAKDGQQALDAYQAGWCAGSEDEVRQIFGRLRLLSPHVHFVKGWFQDTFPQTTVGAIALLHVDADWYDSVRLCLERFWDDVAPGGFVVFDDYARWEGCTRAVDEFLAARALGPLQRTGSAGHYLRKGSSAR